MNTEDFDLSNDLQFDLESGITSFGTTRMVIFNAEAIGLLRHQIIETLGFAEARKLLLRFGFRSGYTDCLQLDLAYEWDTPMDLLAVAPRIHTFEGIVRAEATHVEMDVDDDTLLVEGNWYNSYEADQHLMFYDEADEPVCWSQIGYATGYGCALLDEPILAMETQCAGTGHDHCEMISQNADEWGSEADAYREAYGDLLEA